MSKPCDLNLPKKRPARPAVNACPRLYEIATLARRAHFAAQVKVKSPRAILCFFPAPLSQQDIGEVVKVEDASFNPSRETTGASPLGEGQCPT